MRSSSVARVHVVAVPAPNVNGFRWQWRSEDGAAVSKRAFDLYYDCLDDARVHGYEVQLAARPAELGGSCDAGE